MYKSFTTIFMLILVAMTGSATRGEVSRSAADGFQIVIEKQVDLKSSVVCEKFVTDFPKWWDASHSYSQIKENLSIDLEKMCFLEKLPDGGFVRHMEIIYYEPGSAIRFSGGLGPLQSMGVSGSMSIVFDDSDSGCNVSLTYNVTGSSMQKLDQIAKPVDRVLTEQMDRFVSHAQK